MLLLFAWIINNICKHFFLSISLAKLFVKAGQINFKHSSGKFILSLENSTLHKIGPFFFFFERSGGKSFQTFDQLGLLEAQYLYAIIIQEFSEHTMALILRGVLYMNYGCYRSTLDLVFLFAPSKVKIMNHIPRSNVTQIACFLICL